MRYLALLLLIGCAQQQQHTSKFTQGCILGSMYTFINITQEDWDEQWNYSLYIMCENMEKEIENPQRGFQEKET